MVQVIHASLQRAMDLAHDGHMEVVNKMIPVLLSYFKKFRPKLRRALIQLHRSLCGIHVRFLSLLQAFHKVAAMLHEADSAPRLSETIGMPVLLVQAAETEAYRFDLRGEGRQTRRGRADHVRTQDGHESDE